MTSLRVPLARLMACAVWIFFIASPALAQASWLRNAGAWFSRNGDDAARSTSRAQTAARASGVATSAPIGQRIVRGTSRAREHAHQTSLVTANVRFEGQFIRVDRTMVAISSLGVFASASGMSPSPSPEIDRQVQRELAANAANFNTQYFPLLCLRGDVVYQVPSDTVRCLDGTAPRTTREPLSLRSISLS